MDRLKTILLGVDFSAGSTTAFKQAARIAAWNQAAIRAFHVLDTLVMVDLEYALGEFQTNIRQGMIADVQAQWQKFAAEAQGLGGAGVQDGGTQQIPFDVEVGHPIGSMLEKVKQVAPDLLIMGMSGTSSSPGKGGAGTIATAAVRRARCKTLLVREAQTGPFQRIVVGIDFSDTSLRALEQAVRLATQDSATLHIAHIYSGPWHQLHYRAPTPQANPEFIAQYKQALLGRLQSFCEPLHHEVNYLKASYELVDNPSHGRGLTQFIRDSGADLVVLGTRGRTNLRDLVMGSTAERIVQDAPCSILAVKPAEADEAENRG
jgi:universal stress protein E